MREFAGLARNILMSVDEISNSTIAIGEVVVLTAEPKYYLNDDNEVIAKDRDLVDIRFVVTANSLKYLIGRLSELHDNLVTIDAGVKAAEEEDEVNAAAA